MNIINKIKYWSKVSLFKTLFYSFKYGYLKNKQFIIYPKTKLLIDKSAKIDLGTGHLVCNFSHFGKCFRTSYSILQLKRNASLSLASNNFTLCEGASIIIRENAALFLGGKGFLNTNSKIDCFEKIEIGEGTIIASNVLISDSDSHAIIENGINKTPTKPIKIGNHVWLCNNVIVLKGVSIGDNSIIASGSVVAKDIPSNCLAGGIPAKIIKENCSWTFNI